MPRTEKRGRVHSSTVTVAVMDGAAEQVRGAFGRRGERDFAVAWFSGTGCGGQHRNNHMNSARVTHLPTGLVRTAQTRSRENSLAEAMAALDGELDRMAAAADRDARNGIRKDQVGSGERADRRRIWAFQRGRVEDLVTGRSIPCEDAMRGHVDRLW